MKINYPFYFQVVIEKSSSDDPQLGKGRTPPIIEAIAKVRS